MKTQLIKTLNVLQWTARQPMEEFKKPGDGTFDDYVRKRETLDMLFDELKDLAREEDTLVGRRVSFQTMDGHAHYVVTHVIRNHKCVVQWINYDPDYIDDRLGEKGVLPIDFIEERVRWENAMDGVI